MAGAAQTDVWGDRVELLKPPELIRRMARWQRDYDSIAHPYSHASDDLWDANDREEVAIAQALQAALGQRIAVKLYRHGRWVPAHEVPLPGI